MSLKIAITVVLAMLVVMPFSHYGAYKHGRLTMNAENMEKQGKLSFVLNGRIASLVEMQIESNFGTCTRCHERIPG